MVYVRLEREWTDGQGNAHAPGAMVDVDAPTLAELEKDGIVADPAGGGWVGPTGGDANPTGGEAKPAGGGWVGPTGGSGG